MTNQQLLEYIQSELQKGSDRSVITASLISNGWTKQDIDEAFMKLNIQDSVNESSPSLHKKERPSSVKRFEFLMYGALLLQLLSLIALEGSFFTIYSLPSLVF